MKYFEYLESEDWKLLRAAKLKLSSYGCEACGKKSAHPHVHHVIYRQPIESGVIGDLRIMCESCHNRWHNFERKKGRIIQSGNVEYRWEITLAVLRPKLKRVGRGKLRRAEPPPRFFRETQPRRVYERGGFTAPKTKWSACSERDRQLAAIDRANGF